MKSTHKKIVIGLLVIVVLIIIAYYTGFSHYLSIENIKLNAELYKLQVQEQYFSSVLTFLLFCTFLIACTLPITIPMGVVGGFLFGWWPGFAYSMIATLIGSSISFLIIRYVLYHVVQNRYKKQLIAFNEKIKVYGYSYLVSLQLLSVIPYFVINTLAALAGVSYGTFLWTTAAGASPVVAICAFAGKQLYMIHSWKDVLTKETLLLLILLAGLALVPMIIRKKLYNKRDD